MDSQGGEGRGGGALGGPYVLRWPLCEERLCSELSSGQQKRTKKGLAPLRTRRDASARTLDMNGSRADRLHREEKTKNKKKKDGWRPAKVRPRGGLSGYGLVHTWTRGLRCGVKGLLSEVEEGAAGECRMPSADEVWPRIKSSHARLSDLSILLFFSFCSFS